MAGQSRVSELCTQFAEKCLAYTVWIELVTARCPKIRQALLTGEPIFEPLPGPSSLANGSLSLTGNSTSDCFLDALMDVVDDPHCDIEPRNMSEPLGAHLLTLEFGLSVGRIECQGAFIYGSADARSAHWTMFGTRPYLLLRRTLLALLASTAYGRIAEVQGVSLSFGRRSDSRSYVGRQTRSKPGRLRWDAVPASVDPTLQSRACGGGAWYWVGVVLRAAGWPAAGGRRHLGVRRCTPHQQPVADSPDEAGPSGPSTALACVDQQTYQHPLPEQNGPTSPFQNGYYQLFYQDDHQHQPLQSPHGQHLYNGGHPPPSTSASASTSHLAAGTEYLERPRTGAIHLQQLHCWEQSVLPDGRLAKLTRVQVVSQVLSVRSLSASAGAKNGFRWLFTNGGEVSEGFVLRSIFSTLNEPLQELFCGDGEWAGFGGSSLGPSSSVVSLNGSDPSGDPFGGVLLHNASLPSAMDPSIGLTSLANASQQGGSNQHGHLANGMHPNALNNGQAVCGVQQSPPPTSSQQSGQASNCFNGQNTCGAPAIQGGISNSPILSLDSPIFSQGSPILNEDSPILNQYSPILSQDSPIRVMRLLIAVIRKI
ncbi:hypothetical protein BIW11_09646 [Tropilaelaps mercedesae]|uniref:Uncharacterized protein n=1 Tax=Tropilaelaps mercedesae TaxID=418985 RepID=A0A1V9XJ45_9ACAR|nr:hypothetical protein BIW11_09646 [Tropilaelaps mercedesae]